MINSIVRADYLAAMSAALCFMFIWGAAGTALLTWRHRDRFRYWSAIGTRARRDVLLNVGFFLILLNAAYQRGVNVYALVSREWIVTSLSAKSAPVTVTLALLGTVAFNWWLCGELTHDKRTALLFVAIVCLATILGAVFWSLGQ